MKMAKAMPKHLNICRYSVYEYDLLELDTILLTNESSINELNRL